MLMLLHWQGNLAHEAGQRRPACQLDDYLQGKWDVQPKVDLSKHEHCSWQSMRLPTTVVPVLYDLSLYTDMEVSPAPSIIGPGILGLRLYLALHGTSSAGRELPQHEL